MKKILAILLFLPALAYSQPQLCALTGTFYDFDGSVADSIEVRVIQVYDSSETLIHSRPISYQTDANGVAQFSIIRNSVAYIYARAMNWSSYGSAGRPIVIPDAAAAYLAQLPTPTTIPSSSIVAIPILTVSDSTTGYAVRTDTVRFTKGFKAIVPAGGSGTPSFEVDLTGLNATDTTFIEQRITQAKDSARLANQRLDVAEAEIDTTGKWKQTGTLIRPKPGIDTVVLLDDGVGDITVTNDPFGAKNITASEQLHLHSPYQLQTTTYDHDMQAGEDVNIDAGAFLRLRPTVGTYMRVGTSGDEWINTELIPQGLRINPRGRVSIGAAYSIFHHPLYTPSARIDSVWLRNGRELVRWLDSVQTVVNSAIIDSAGLAVLGDPMYARSGAVQARISAALDSAFTAGQRSISSTGRIFAASDSITLTVAPNETINCALGNTFRGTITANDTLGFTNGVDGQVIQVVITNAGTHTLTWTGVAWPGGTAPVLTAVANKRSIFSFLVSGGMVHGVSVLNY